MSDSAMNIGKFRDLLSTYGTDFSRWPADSVPAAEALLLKNETARSAYDEAGAVDTLFNAGDAQAPKGLVDKIMAKIDSNKH